MKKGDTKNKKVTIDDLARMIAEGREETNELARMVAKGFESVDKKFDEVKKDIVEIKQDIVEIRQDIVEIKQDVSHVKQEIVALNHAQDETNRRLTSIERKQAGALESMDDTVTRKEFQALASKVAVLEKSR